MLWIFLLNSTTLSQHVDVNLMSSLLSRMENYDKKIAQMEENNCNQISELEESYEKRIVQMEGDIEERVSKLEQLARIGTLRSCAEYSRYGLKSSGMYNIDPDGPLLGSEPFQVYCNFETGATEVIHDSENLTVVEHCHDPGKTNEI